MNKSQTRINTVQGSIAVKIKKHLLMIYKQATLIKYKIIKFPC